MLSQQSWILSGLGLMRAPSITTAANYRMHRRRLVLEDHLRLFALPAMQ